MTAVWCAIPVYNNAATIAEVARRCREHMAHILVVDDGSTDADLRDLLKPLNVVVLRHPTNQGKGAAMLTAFRYAAEQGAQYLITLDGDAQHLPDDIPRFLSALTPHTILIGSRDQVIGVMPHSSRFGREFSDFWINLETGAAVKDSQSGFRAYPVQDVLKLPLHTLHYNMETEILTRALWAGLHIRSVSIHVAYPDPSQRVSSFRPVIDNARLTMVHTRLILRRLLPIPHRRIVSGPKRSYVECSSPMNLAAAAGIGILLGIVLWPWGFIATLYLALRLHLNKMMVLAALLICLPHGVPALSLRIGDDILQPGSNVHLKWFVGSHILAIFAVPMFAVIVYTIARRLQSATNRRNCR